MPTHQLTLPGSYAFGSASSGAWVGHFSGKWGWRFVFMFEAVAMLPFIIWGFVVKADGLRFDAKPAPEDPTQQLIHPTSDSAGATALPASDDAPRKLSVTGSQHAAVHWRIALNFFWQLNCRLTMLRRTAGPSSSARWVVAAWVDERIDGWTSLD